MKNWMKRHLCIEGVDRVGKSSLIQNFQNKMVKIFEGPYHVIHSQNFKSDGVTGESLENHSHVYYSQQMDLWKTDPEECKFIFDRAHLGETVYSPLYRNYSGQYVWALERLHELATDNVILILLTDSAENLLRREDGESLSGADLDKKRSEIEAFDKAFDDSLIRNKIRIDVGRYDNAEEVFGSVIMRLQHL